MAGIGFELRKVIATGGLGSFIKAAFSGVMIVAGPWLFSVVGITLIQRLIAKFSAGGNLFTATVIFSYAFSLILFGGLHLIYTRIVADLLFLNKQSEAAGTLVFFMALIGIGALALSVPIYFSFEPPVAAGGLYRAGAIILFLAVNLVWALMIFITLLRRYLLILLIYAGGIGLAIGLVMLLSPKYGVGGSLFGFALGHFIIAICLAALAFTSYRPKGVGRSFHRLRSYISNYFVLFLTGYFYNWAIWIDKVIFWFTRGTAVPGTIFRLYEPYDLAVYIANLSMIPGLVYFVIVSETGFYVQLRKFLLTLSKGTYAQIQGRKRMLLSGVRLRLRQQTLFQGIITTALIFLAPAIVGIFNLAVVSPFTVQIVLVGVFLHFFSLTVMNYHFYFEFFHHALTLSFIFFGVNFVITLLMTSNLLPFVPGAGYAAGAFCSAVFGYAAIFISGRSFDRRVLAKSSGV